MNKTVTNIIWIFFTCSLYGHLQSLTIFGMEKLFKVVPSIFYGAYYGFLLSLMYFISLKFLKSEVVFFIISWLTCLGLFFSNLSGAQDRTLTLYRYGHAIYSEGNISEFGILYEFLDPIGITAIVATILIVRKVVLYLKGKGAR